MSHQRVARLLARRSELSPSEERRVRAHLNACEDCRRRAAEYSSQNELLRNIDQPDALVGLRSAILSQAASAAGARTSRESRRSPFAMAAGAAGLVIVGVFGVTLAFGHSGGQGRVLSEASAIRAALKHTVLGLDKQVPPKVRVSARLGAFDGANPAWIVTISGPPVRVLSPQALTVPTPVASSVVVHKETAVVNGRTGAYIEAFAVEG